MIMNEKMKKLQAGFKLNTQVKVLGPMLLFPRTVLAWKIDGSNDVTEESLKLIDMLEPKIELLVLGLDAEYHPQSPLMQDLRKLMRKLGIAHEIQPVDKAISIFNFANGDGRYVVGAFVPPRGRETTHITPIKKKSKD